MNHRKHSGSAPRHFEQQARDVLAGRVQIAVVELLDLIHEINPTGRLLNEADERRRYELKSRLQSLLVRRFIEELELTSEPGGILAIRHRYLRQDGCHAKLDDLEPDARAQVRLRLDMGDEVPAEPGAAAIVPSWLTHEPNDPLRLAREALRDYDYETARHQFERACEANCYELPAARELLELLVDHLCLDAEAVALEDMLSPRAVADPGVRALLAIAYARIGDPAAVLRLLGDSKGSRAGDGWTALANVAAGRQDLTALEHAIARLHEADPAHAELLRLRDSMDRLRATARAPEEETLRALATRADDASLEAAARAHLVRWPESPVARELLRLVAGRQREANARRYRQEAEDALRAGDLRQAAARSRDAEACGADVETLRRQIDEARAEASHAADEAAVHAVIAGLAGPDLRAGLAAFVELEAPLRARVRSGSDRPQLVWLEVLVEHAARAGTAALVDTVLAVAAALDAYERGDDDQVFSLLEPHEERIAALPRARQLRAEALRRREAHRRETASHRVEEAERSLADGDLDGCERACAAVDRRWLEPVGRERLARLLEQLRHDRDVQHQRACIEAHLSNGDLLAARRALARLIGAESARGNPTDDLRVRMDATAAELRKAWCVLVEPFEQSTGEIDRLGELMGHLPYLEWCAPLVVDDGRQLVAAAVYDSHVFLGTTMLNDGRMIRRTYVRTPEPLGEVSSVDVDGESLWIVGHAFALQMSWKGGDPLSWRKLAPTSNLADRIERAFVVPPSHLWVETYDPEGDGRSIVHVMDVHGGGIRRELVRPSYLVPRVANGESIVAAIDDERGAILYDPRGAVREHVLAAVDMDVSDMIFGPDRNLFVFGANHRDDEGAVEIRRIVAGQVADRFVLPDSHYEKGLRPAWSQRTDLLFILHHGTDGEQHLVALRRREAGLELAFRVKAPGGAILAHDAAANDVVCLWDTSGGVRLARLGVQPLSFGNSTRIRQTLPAFGRFFYCDRRSAGVPADDRRADACEPARKAADHDDWPEVRRLLEDVQVDSTSQTNLAHYHHLLGIALLRTGAPRDQVRRVWEAGRAYDSTDGHSCRLTDCVTLVEPVPIPLTKEWWNAREPLARQLLGAIVTADSRMAAGDPPSAIAALRRRSITRSDELQSAGRLAAAWLELEVEGAERFDKAIALARLVALRRGRYRANLPVEEAWDDERLDQIVARADQWLASWPSGRGVDDE